MRQLAQLINPGHPEEALKNFPVVITHIKPGLLNGRSIVDVIIEELQIKNDLGVNFIIPQQGKLLSF